MRNLFVADVKSYSREGKSFGHYFQVAQNYSELYSNHFEVFVAGGPIYKKKFFANRLFLLPCNYEEGKNFLTNKFNVLKNCFFLFRKTKKDDIIILQHSGASTTFLGIGLMATKRNSIYVIQYDTDAVSSIIKRMIYKLAKPKIKGILCPNDVIAQSYGKPYCVVMDYIYVFSDKEKIDSINYKEKKYDFVFVGGISKDKGIVEVARKLVNTKYNVFIAGRGDENVCNKLQTICEKAPNVKLSLGYVNEENYSIYIREARYCILNYQGVYTNRSSGVVLDAIFNGTPIAGHRCSALQFIEDEKVGYLFDNIEDFNPSDILNEERYNMYIDGISSYLAKQDYYKQKVLKFLKDTL